LADQLEKNKRMEEDSGKLKNRTVELEKENARALQEIQILKTDRIAGLEKDKADLQKQMIESNKEKDDLEKTNKKARDDINAQKLTIHNQSNDLDKKNEEIKD